MILLWKAQVWQVGLLPQLCLVGLFHAGKSFFEKGSWLISKEGASTQQLLSANPPFGVGQKRWQHKVAKAQNVWALGLKIGVENM